MKALDHLAARQAEGIRARGFRAHASGARVLMPAVDFEALAAEVLADDRLGPVGRGWYLNGNDNMVLTPEWPWNMARVACLRLFALAVYRPLRPVVRLLASRMGART